MTYRGRGSGGGLENYGSHYLCALVQVRLSSHVRAHASFYGASSFFVLISSIIHYTLHICIYIYIYICIYIYRCIHVCVCMYVYIYIYIHIYTHTHNILYNKVMPYYITSDSRWPRPCASMATPSKWPRAASLAALGSVNDSISK